MESASIAHGPEMTVLVHGASIRCRVEGCASVPDRIHCVDVAAREITSESSASTSSTRIHVHARTHLGTSEQLSNASADRSHAEERVSVPTKDALAGEWTGWRVDWLASLGQAVQSQDT